MANHNKSVAQVILRWLTQRGVIAIPKSARKERMEEIRILQEERGIPEYILSQFKVISKRDKIKVYDNINSLPNIFHFVFLPFHVHTSESRCESSIDSQSTPFCITSHL